MTASRIPGRFRAYLEFVAALLWFIASRHLAARAASGLVREEWSPYAEQLFLVFLLYAGFSFMGRVFDHQTAPMAQQGLPRREGWRSEAGLGLAIGWTIAVLCLLPITFFGGVSIALSIRPSAWGWLLVELVYFALATLAQELFLRGYAFQRFSQSLGSFGAAIGFAFLTAFLDMAFPGANRASFAVSLVFSLLLTTAYLRTRALWLGWGIHFAWKASRALLFGLAISGVSSHSPVVQGNPMGPFWLTGGGFGLDGSWLAFVVLVAALPVLLRLTRDLDFRWNAPVLIPGGIPVDLDAASRRQHEQAMGPVAPAPAPLIQIQPLAAPPPPVPSPEPPPPPVATPAPPSDPD